jgi:hypothetical protein
MALVFTIVVRRQHCGYMHSHDAELWAKKEFANEFQVCGMVKFHVFICHNLLKKVVGTHSSPHESA